MKSNTVLISKSVLHRLQLAGYRQRDRLQARLRGSNQLLFSKPDLADMRRELRYPTEALLKAEEARATK